MTARAAVRLFLEPTAGDLERILDHRSLDVLHRRRHRLIDADDELGRRERRAREAGMVRRLAAMSSDRCSGISTAPDSASATMPADLVGELADVARPA